VIEVPGVAKLVNGLDGGAVKEPCASFGTRPGVEARQREDGNAARRIRLAEDEVQTRCVEIDVGDAEQPLPSRPAGGRERIEQHCRKVLSARPIVRWPGNGYPGPEFDGATKRRCDHGQEIAERFFTDRADRHEGDQIRHDSCTCGFIALLDDAIHWYALVSMRFSAGRRAVEKGLFSVLHAQRAPPMILLAVGVVLDALAMLGVP
jgi:hypothetical protein